MFKFFKVKTKIEYQIDEYVEYKAKSSIYSAKEHRLVLDDFLRFHKFTDLHEVSIEAVRLYRDSLSKDRTNYTTQKAMQALRCFLRYHKKQVDFNPELIQNMGIVDLSDVDISARIKPMITEEKKLGRPFTNKELSITVKRLRDREGLSFRKIGEIIRRDVSYVYRLYYRKLPPDVDL